MTRPRRTQIFPPERPHADGRLIVRIDPSLDAPVGFAVAASEIDGPDGWLLRGTCAVLNRGLSLVTLSITPWERRPATLDALAPADPQPVRLGSDALRKVHVPKVERAVYGAVRDMTKDAEFAAGLAALQEELGFASVPSYPAKDATGLMKGMKRPGVKRGPIGYGDDFYRWVAKTYLRLVEADGHIYAEIRDASVEEGWVTMRPEVSTVKKWIWEARRRKFLPPSSPGRRSTAPGPMLEDDVTSNS